MRANRQLGTALVEYNLVKIEDLEAANERLLEHLASGEMRQASLLSVLVYEKKALREDDVLHHVVDDHALGVVDLRGYEVPEEGFDLAIDLIDPLKTSLDQVFGRDLAVA